ncbi:hypothetical protein D3C80_1264980 [compost metagenome]
MKPVRKAGNIRARNRQPRAETEALLRQPVQNQPQDLNEDRCHQSDKPAENGPGVVATHGP